MRQPIRIPRMVSTSIIRSGIIWAGARAHLLLQTEKLRYRNSSASFRDVQNVSRCSRHRVDHIRTYEAATRRSNNSSVCSSPFTEAVPPRSTVPADEVETALPADREFSMGHCLLTAFQLMDNESDVRICTHVYALSWPYAAECHSTISSAEYLSQVSASDIDDLNMATDARVQHTFTVIPCKHLYIKAFKFLINRLKNTVCIHHSSA
jgi:hypothetical protein